MKVPVIKGDRIILRPKKVSDAPLMAKWLKDREVMKYFSHNFYRSTVEQEKVFIKDLPNKNNNFINFSIVLKDSGKMIGDVGAEVERFNGAGNMWIMIGDKKEWHKGYGQESMNLFMEYFFGVIGLNRLEIEVSADYQRGLKIYKKMGFVKEGIKRGGEWDRFEKKHKDQVLMSILYDDYWSARGY